MFEVCSISVWICGVLLFFLQETPPPRDPPPLGVSYDQFGDLISKSHIMLCLTCVHVRVKMRGCSCLGMFFQSLSLRLFDERNILLGKCYFFGNLFSCLTLLGVRCFFLFLCSCGSAPVWGCVSMHRCNEIGADAT